MEKNLLTEDPQSFSTQFRRGPKFGNSYNQDTQPSQENRGASPPKITTNFGFSNPSFKTLTNPQLQQAPPATIPGSGPTQFNSFGLTQPGQQQQSTSQPQSQFSSLYQNQPNKFVSTMSVESNPPQFGQQYQNQQPGGATLGQNYINIQESSQKIQPTLTSNPSYNITSSNTQQLQTSFNPQPQGVIRSSVERTTQQIAQNVQPVTNQLVSPSYVTISPPKITKITQSPPRIQETLFKPPVQAPLLATEPSTTFLQAVRPPPTTIIRSPHRSISPPQATTIITQQISNPPQIITQSPPPHIISQQVTTIQPASIMQNSQKKTVIVSPPKPAKPTAPKFEQNQFLSTGLQQQQLQQTAGSRTNLHQQKLNQNDLSDILKSQVPQQQGLSQQASQINVQQSQTNLQQPINISQNDINMSSYIKKYNIPTDLMAFDQDYFPQYTMFLLSDEEKNIQNFRERIQKEKQRVEEDVGIFQQEITNLLHDLKVSMTQAIDDHYINFIEKYKKFKNDVVDYKNVKLEVPTQTVKPPSNFEGTINTSNAQLLKELEDLRYKNQVSKIQQYITEIQKESLSRILVVSQEILQIMSSSSQLYNGDSTCKTFTDIKSNFAQNISLKFDPLNQFIKSIFAVEDEQQANQPGGFDGGDGISPFKPTVTLPQHNLSPSRANNQNNISYHHPQQLNQNFQQQQQNESPVRDSNPQMSGNNYQFNKPEINNNVQPEFANMDYQTTPYQQQQQQPPTQIQKSYYNQVVSLPTPFTNNQVQVIQNSQIPTTHSDIILCTQAFSPDLIATGSKDGEIEVYNPYTKQQIANLQSHKGPICCLGKIGNFLASGSDHGDCSIVLWDMQTYKPVRSLEGHQAAVVSLLSLQDNETLVSASYDKEIIFWNAQTGAQIQKLSCHNSSVTCICLSEDGQYLVSGSLDNQFNVYRLNYKPDNTFESAYLDKTFQVPNFAVQIQIVGDYIFSGHRDGKIRVIDLENGEITMTLGVTLGSISDFLVYKDSNNQIKVVGSGTKENALFVTDMSGNTQKIDCSGIFIEFGCGIGPKIQHLSQDQICVISQLSTQKEVSIYQLQI